MWFYVIKYITNKSYCYKQQQISETIDWLYGNVNRICDECHFKPIYNIYLTNNITHVEKSENFKGDINGGFKGDIYISIWNDKLNRTFHKNTLIYAVLHEIAHLLSPSEGHQEPFDNIENILLNKAIELDIWDPNIIIESNYKTMEHL